MNYTFTINIDILKILKIYLIGFIPAYLNVKASQYNHIEDTYKKKKLSERWNILGDDKVQRDLYSAFIIKNVKDDLKSIDKDKMIKGYSKFLELHNKEIERIKNIDLKTLKCMGF